MLEEYIPTIKKQKRIIIISLLYLSFVGNNLAFNFLLLQCERWIKRIRNCLVVLRKRENWWKQEDVVWIKYFRMDEAAAAGKRSYLSLTFCIWNSVMWTLFWSYTVCVDVKMCVWASAFLLRSIPTLNSCKLTGAVEWDGGLGGGGCPLLWEGCQPLIYRPD